METTEVGVAEKVEIKLIIVYGTNKPLDVERAETIETVKLGAMGEFGIPAGEKDQYILKAKVDSKEEQLDEAKTVEHYHLHDDQKVTLAAGTPFGGE
jgi:hypothetical protein